MGHYYDAAGNPRHTYTNDKGKIIPMRFPQVAKENLFPSVSTVLKDTLANSQLIEYAKKQVAEAAWDVAFRDFRVELKEDWIYEVLEASEADKYEAADLGTAIHASIENYTSGAPYNMEHALYIECVR